MNDNYAFFEYFKQYLKHVRNNKDETVYKYERALKKISNILKDKGFIEDSIYEVVNIDELTEIKEYLFSWPEFVACDERGHRMYSAALNNYYRFACGEHLDESKERIKLLDIRVERNSRNTRIVEYWKRSSIIKVQSIKAANYSCEIEEKHKTFIAKSTGKQYMEGHHAIPLNRQEQFNVSLDIYANVVCLCPICHRLIHYGEDRDKELVLDKIYYDRSDRLAKSGLSLSREEFKKQII